MRLRQFVVVLLAGLAGGLSLSTQAQEAWTLSRVLQQTWATYPQLQEKRAQQLAAQADWEAMKWQRYPTPTLEANTAQQGGGTLRIDQPLWTGGRITASIDMAEAKFETAKWLVDEARLEVSSRSIAAWVEALRQAERRRYAEQGVREHDKLLEMIQRRVSQEVSSQADQRLAMSRLYGSRNDLSLAVQAHNTVLAQLAQLVGQPVALVSDAEGDLPSQPLPATLEAATAEALSHSAKLKRLEWEEKVAEADMDVKRSAWWPQLLYRYERVHAGQETDSRSMLVLQAQPGAGLSARSGVQAAIAKRDAARQNRLLAEREISEQASQLWYDWQAARERVANSEAARSMSSDVAASYARQYTAGRKNWLDVLNAVREATQSEFAWVDAQAQMRLAAWKIRALVGALAPAEEATSAALPESKSR